MRGRAAAIGVTLLLLGGCGKTTLPGENVAELAANSTEIADGGAACAATPAFVPVHRGALIVNCVAAQAGDSGSLAYRIRLTPGRVLDWTRRRADQTGFHVRLATGTMLTADTPGRKQTIAVVVVPIEGGAQATVTWSKSS